MSTKKTTPLQKHIAFAVKASLEELNAAIEVLTAVKANKFAAPAASEPRKPRSDKGLPKVKATPPNGGDTEGAPV